MSEGGPNIALLYDEGSYVEILQAPRQPAPNAPLGLMGRQVAGKEFLDAYLGHGTWTELVALVRERSQADSLVRVCQAHPSSRSKTRRLMLVEEREFHARFFPTPPARLLCTPAPPDMKYAWARQHGGPGSFALCGVTHTLCSLPAVDQLCAFVTAPYEPYDALICTSSAVTQMVRAVTGAYADYLQDRHGGSPALRIRLETIPLGVNPERFRPPTSEERAAHRQALKIAGDEVVVLFVGRLSHHAKAHPFPMFHGIAQAARTTGRKVHLILAGWAVHPAVQQAFLDGARIFAPGVRVSIVDGTRPEFRTGVWHAADLFTSLSDNVQETFGLVVIEAMASSLPVVASDWDGYRDLVTDGDTGFLVPTAMVHGATLEATSRLLVGEIGYDQFLAECSQAAIVDLRATAAAYARLLSDEPLRRTMGAAGRRRVLERFRWEDVIRRYEALWRSQEQERRAWVDSAAIQSRDGPGRYPAPERSFAGYPTRWLRDDDLVQTVAEARSGLHALLTLPLTNHVSESRVHDSALLRTLLDAAASGCPVSALDEVLRSAGTGHTRGRATLAWMLKYGLLQACSDSLGRD